MSPVRSSFTIVITGDSVVGRALSLLLQSHRYETMFVPVLELLDPDIVNLDHILLMTPIQELDFKRREVLKEILEGYVCRRPVLRLVSSSDEELYHGRYTGEGICTEQIIHWPCSTTELKARIEAAIPSAFDYGDSPVARGQKSREAD